MTGMCRVQGKAALARAALMTALVSSTLPVAAAPSAAAHLPWDELVSTWNQGKELPVSPTVQPSPFKNVLRPERSTQPALPLNASLPFDITEIRPSNVPENAVCRSVVRKSSDHLRGDGYGVTLLKFNDKSPGATDPPPALGVEEFLAEALLLKPPSSGFSDSYSCSSSSSSSRCLGSGFRGGAAVPRRGAALPFAVALSEPMEELPDSWAVADSRFFFSKEGTAELTVEETNIFTSSLAGAVQNIPHDVFIRDVQIAPIEGVKPVRSVYDVEFSLRVDLRTSGFLVSNDMEFNLAAFSSFLHRHLFYAFNSTNTKSFFMRVREAAAKKHLPVVLRFHALDTLQALSHMIVTSLPPEPSPTEKGRGASSSWGGSSEL